jgi:hypothetical protein
VVVFDVRDVRERVRERHRLVEVGEFVGLREPPTSRSASRPDGFASRREGWQERRAPSRARTPTPFRASIGGAAGSVKARDEITD